MLTAYNFAMQKHGENAAEIVKDDVLEMLDMIEPKKNASGYRRTPVYFANGNTIGAQNIEHQMANLIRFQDSLEPLEFYIELERIHPAHDKASQSKPRTLPDLTTEWHRCIKRWC